jgi:hypothetical protein
MAGYTKLFSSIVHSTIWREENHVRLVWITMMAICDKNGIVEASLPGLADLARVSIKECQDALERLSAPDKWSRTQDHEGRRIEAVDGGWRLLNHAKYRGMLVAEKKRESNRIRQQRYREKHSESVTRNAVSRCNAQSDPDPEADPTTEEGKKKTKAKKGYSKRFMIFWGHWLAHVGSVGKFPASKAFEKLEQSGELPDDDVLHNAIVAEENARKATIANGHFFAEWKNPATWLNQHCWEDKHHVKQRSAALHPPMSQQERNLEIIRRGREKREREAREAGQMIKVAGKTEVVR